MPTPANSWVAADAASSRGSIGTPEPSKIIRLFRVRLVSSSLLITRNSSVGRTPPSFGPTIWSMLGPLPPVHSDSIPPSCVPPMSSADLLRRPLTIVR